MSFLFIQLRSGLANAMVLFLIASGLTLIFGVTRIVNFAHGSLYMLAAYLTYSLVSALPLGAAGFYVAVLLAAALVAVFGGLVEVALLRRVYRAPELYQLLLTFALVLVVADAVRFVWGADNKTGPEAPGLAGSIRVAGQLFPTYDLAMIAMGPLVALGLWWLFYRTRWGILIRAATQDREMVAALGVDQRRLFTGVFVLGSFLAGLAGALQVPRTAITTVMDTTVIVEAFVVVVIGGMGSVWGALLASLLIGVLGAFGILILPRISIVLIFVVMALVLIVRPWGLLGRARGPAPAASDRVVGGIGGRAGRGAAPPAHLLRLAARRDAGLRAVRHEPASAHGHWGDGVLRPRGLFRVGRVRSRIADEERRPADAAGLPGRAAPGGSDRRCLRLLQRKAHEHLFRHADAGLCPDRLRHRAPVVRGHRRRQWTAGGVAAALARVAGPLLLL